MKLIQDLKDGSLYVGFIALLVILVVVGATALSTVLG